MTMFGAENLRKSFFDVEVVKGVSFDLGQGQVLGLIGENGSGKSTCMNMVAGLLAPDSGAMTLDGNIYAPTSPHVASAAGIAFIHQELNLFENLSVAENLAIGAFPLRLRRPPLIDRGRMRDRAAELLQRVELSVRPDTPLNRLAPGERQLVEIAKAFSSEPRIIIFDEPTTSLTAREAERLFILIAQMRGRGIGIIYISHILEDVLRTCDRVDTLRDGLIVDRCEKADLTIERMTESMLGKPMRDFFPVRPANARSKKSGAPALAVSRLTQPGTMRDVSFEVHPGEIVGIAGLMGSGRSETARAIFGLDPAKGDVFVRGQRLASRSPRACMAAGIAFLTEDRRGDGLLMAESIFRNLELPWIADASRSAFASVPVRKLATSMREVAGRLGIRARDLASQPVRTLSGGNQQKTVLGKWLLRKPAILILDEPTRGIDVGAKTEIYRIVEELALQGAAVLFISSQLEELLGTCHRILAMAHGEIVGEFEGPAFDRDAIIDATMSKQTLN